MENVPENQAPPRPQSRLRPLVTSAAASVVVFAMLVVAVSQVHIGSSHSSSARESPVPSLAVSGINRLSRDDSTRDLLELLDPSPLFMPGLDAVHGASATDLRDRPGGRVAELFPPSMVFKENAAGRELLAPDVPDSEVAALAVLLQRRLFFGLAHQDRREQPDATGYRSGKVEIYSAARTTPEQEFELGALPGVVSSSWRPMEFRLLVGPSGLPTQLVAVASSGVDEVDSALRVKLAGDILPQLRLKPGDYRILAGP